MLASRRAVFGALLTATAFVAVFGSAFQIPLPPAAGPDPSWMVALGQAAQNHLVFGRDVIYTWGPLGYLDVPGVVPATYAAKTLFALAVAGATALIVVLRMGSEGSLWQRVAFVLGASIVFPYAGALYLAGEGDAQILLVMTLAFTFPALSLPKPVRLLAFTIGVLAGFASLIKFSLFVSLLAVGLVAFAARIVQHRKLPELHRADIEATALYAAGFAASSVGFYYWVTFGFRYEAVLAIAAIAGALLWIARSSGKVPSLAFVPVWIPPLLVAVCSAIVLAAAPYREFLYYSFQIAAGYSSAVSQGAHSSAIAIALLFLVMTALLAIREAASLGTARLVVIVAVLCITFKQCFVRQDDTHMLPYFLTISLAGCILLLSAARPRSAVYAAFLTVLSLPIAFLVALSLPISPLLVKYGQTDVRRALFPAAIAVGVLDALRMRASNDTSGLAPDVLASPVREKLGNVPVDLVGTEINIVFANGLAWRPRPAFHAPYSVFTPALDALNRDAIASGDTGRELLTYGSVDRRYPFGDEPMTSRQLICNYATDEAFPSNVATLGGTGLTILRRSRDRCGAAASNRSGAIGWNEPLRIGTLQDRLAFLFIDFHYTALGKAVESLYRIAPVWIHVRYRSGSTSKYRVLPELLSGGLLINPIPRNLREIRSLYAGVNADPVETVEFTSANASLFTASMTYRIEEVPYARARSSSTSARSS